MRKIILILIFFIGIQYIEPLKAQPFGHGQNYEINKLVVFLKDIQVNDEIILTDGTDTYILKISADRIRIYNDNNAVVASFDSIGALRAGTNERRVFSLSENETVIRFADDQNVGRLDIAVGSSGALWSTFDGNNQRFCIGNNSPNNTFEVNSNLDTLAAFYGDVDGSRLGSADSVGMVILPTGAVEFWNSVSLQNLTADPSAGTGHFLRAQNSADADTLIFRYSAGTLKRWISED